MNEIFEWIGYRVDDVFGGRLGKLEAVYADAEDGTPQWLLVNTRRFDSKHVLIPAHDAVQGGGHVWVPYEREVVKGAPDVTPGAPLSRRRELMLCNHYGLHNRVAVLEERSARGATAQLATGLSLVSA